MCISAGVGGTTRRVPSLTVVQECVGRSRNLGATLTDGAKGTFNLSAPGSSGSPQRAWPTFVGALCNVLGTGRC